MEKDALKRMAVMFIAVMFIALCLTIPLMYFVLEAPIAMVAVAAVIYLALAGGMAYYTRERLQEIEEGLDDAVDDY